jgi:hypothetical protein
MCQPKLDFGHLGAGTQLHQQVGQKSRIQLNV